MNEYEKPHEWHFEINFLCGINAFLQVSDYYLFTTLKLARHLEKPHKTKLVLLFLFRLLVRFSSVTDVHGA